MQDERWELEVLPPLDGSDRAKVSKMALFCRDNHGRIVGDTAGDLPGLYIAPSEHERLHPDGSRSAIGRALFTSEVIPPTRSGVRVLETPGTILTVEESNWRRRFGFGGYVHFLVNGWVLWCRDQFVLGNGLGEAVNGSAGLVAIGTDREVEPNADFLVDTAKRGVVYLKTRPNTLVRANHQLVVPFGSSYTGMDYALPPVTADSDLWVMFAQHRRGLRGSLLAIIRSPAVTAVLPVVVTPPARRVLWSIDRARAGVLCSRTAVSRHSRFPSSVIPQWAIDEFMEHESSISSQTVPSVRSVSPSLLNSLASERFLSDLVLPSASESVPGSDESPVAHELAPPSSGPQSPGCQMS